MLRMLTAKDQRIREIVLVYEIYIVDKLLYVFKEYICISRLYTKL
jgi:hypothetical protein